MDLLDQQCTPDGIGVANRVVASLISALLASHCNLSPTKMWPEDDGPKALAEEYPLYDFVIIGAGSAGSLVANHLSEKRRYKVLLIEAGADPPIESEIPGLAFSTLNTHLDWQYHTHTDGLSCQAMKDNSCLWSQGKVLGGSSTINDMIYHRGTQRDYDDWQILGNSMWGWTGVFDYFRKFEGFNGEKSFFSYGADGPVKIESFETPKYMQQILREAADELGYRIVKDFIMGKDLGFGKFYGTLTNGRRMSAAKAFLNVKRSNLHVVKQAVAKNIEIGHRRKAGYVNFVYKGIHEVRVKVKREVIVSAGAVGTPKLLMLSGIGPAAHLKELGIPVKSDLSVGDNLQDHVKVDFYLKYNYTNKHSAILQQLDNTFEQWIFKSGQLGMSTMNFGGFIDTNHKSSYPNVYIKFIPIQNFSHATEKYKDSIQTSLLKQILPRDQVLGISIVLLKPGSRGRIRLKSPDYRDEPFIVPNYFSDKNDLKIMVDAIKELLAFTTTYPLKVIKGEFLRVDLPGCDAMPFETDIYWECYSWFMSSSSFDLAGSVKMGPKWQNDTVVDSELLVKGVRGLRVIDASIMPNIVSAPTNAATLMIGAKGVDFVKKTWKY